MDPSDLHLIFIAALWLISRIILLIAPIVSRRQFGEARRLLAAAQAAERSRPVADSPLRQPTASTVPVLRFPDLEPTPVLRPPLRVY